MGTNGRSVRADPGAQRDGGDVVSMQAVQVEAIERFREIDDPRIARSADDQPY